MGFNPPLVWDSQSCSLFTLFLHHFFHFLYFSFFPSYFFLSSQKIYLPLSILISHPNVFFLALL
uniref:Uncharacterized protein n=1 Tax=Meloidogyne enterolobii TaxID=390850 RepID=A0A6V7WLZ3_MELEN|nr:unnamed protein product [Meloidogyne enterolobii]